VEPAPGAGKPEEFKAADTHGSLWNAAQRQALAEGRERGFY
jgi:hypothetical protein